MRIVRFLSAAALLVLGCFLAFAVATALLSGVRMHPVQGPLGIAFILLLLLTAGYFFRSRAWWESRVVCPRCQQPGALAPSFLRRPRIGVVGGILGGFIGSVVFTHARKRGYVCNACQSSVDLRTVGGWIALSWFVLMVMALALAIYLNARP